MTSEKQPTNESLVDPLILQIDRMRLKAFKDEFDPEKLERLSEKIFSFDTDFLRKQYEHKDLWATPAWHRLIGSSQQGEVFESDKIQEISDRIQNFVDEVLENWDSL